MTIIKLKNRLTCIGWLSAILALPAGVFADGTDDFNDDSKDTTKWGDDVVESGVGALIEQTQRLEFIANTPATDGNTFRPWIVERFPVDSDWTIQVDVHNGTAPAIGEQTTSAGLRIFHPTKETSNLYFEFGAFPPAKFVALELQTSGHSLGYHDVQVSNGSAVTGAIRMEYDGGTKVLSCFYDADISNGYQWTAFNSFGLAGTGGATANTDWKLSAGQQISVWVYGYSVLTAVASGDLYLDNFIETGGAVPTGGPAPAPTGHFGFQFPTNNPLLVAIACITGNFTGTDPFGSSRQYNIDVAQDESGKLATVGTVDGITDSQGGTDLSASAGAVTTANNEPTLALKSSFTGVADGVPASGQPAANGLLSLKSTVTSIVGGVPFSGKLTANGPLELADIGGGSNGVAVTASGSAKVNGVPLKASNVPALVPSTPSLEANLSKDWTLDLDISEIVVNGKTSTVASAELTLPNGDVISFPETKAKYSTTKGYKLSFKKGTNITVNPNRIDKKSSISIAGLTFEKQGDEWVPTAGTISYQFLGQRGTANLLDFTTP